MKNSGRKVAFFTSGEDVLVTLDFGHLDAAEHGADENGALFRPIKNNRTGRLERAITADGMAQ